MSTRITFVDDELAHYGVKGMRWGVRRMQAKRAGRATARSQIRAHDTILTARANAANKKTKTLKAKWRDTEHEVAFEKSRNKELRKQMRWNNKGIEVASRTGDDKTKAIAKKRSTIGNKVARNMGIRAATLTLAVAGPMAYSYMKHKVSTSSNLKVRNLYNKYAKTGIYDIKL